MSPANLAARQIIPAADAIQHPEASPTLKSLRDQMDALDLEILDLVQRRQAVARRIGEVKGADAPGLKLRPDREAEVVRHMIAAAPPENRRYIQALWREVMSAGLSAQGQVEVAVWSGPRKDAAVFARSRFGGSADYRDVATPADALAAAEADGVAVLALDPDVAWWADLPERDGLWVFEALGRRGPADPVVLCVAKLEPSVIARGISYRVSLGGDSGGDGRAERLISVSQGARLYALTDKSKGPLDRAHGIIGCAPSL